MDGSGRTTGAEPGAAPRTLSLGTSLLRGSHMRIVTAVSLAIPAIPLGVLAWLTQREDGGAAAGDLLLRVWAALVEDAGDDPVAWLLFALAALAPMLLYGQRLARLRITSLGLQGHVPRWLGLGLVRQTGGDWDLRWEEVTGARLEGPGRAVQRLQQLNACRLVIETSRQEIRLSPFAWFDRSGEDHRLGLRELAGSGRPDVDELLRRTPLFRALEARGIAVDARSAASGPGAAFDLARHRGMVTQLALLTVAGGYAIADAFFIGSYRALEPLPLWPFGLAAAAGVPAVRRLGRGAPRLERAAVGALAVVAMVAAVYPGALRYNAATATPETVAYVAVGHGRFEAPDHPALDLSGHVDEYWREFPPGSTHEFTLLRGAAGFYQLDMAPLHARTRTFYRSRDESGR